MNKIQVGLAAFVVMLGLVALVQPQPVGAINLFDKCTAGEVCKEAQAAKSKGDGLIKSLIGTLLFIVGTIAVIMIIVGGLKYTTSNGDQTKVTSAKNTILYSVVGLVVALLAFAIVNFVLDNF